MQGDGRAFGMYGLALPADPKLELIALFLDADARCAQGYQTVRCAAARHAPRANAVCLLWPEDLAAALQPSAHSTGFKMAIAAFDIRIVARSATKSRSSSGTK